MNRSISCDYLIVGTGAMGMAFADELHAQQPNAELVLVDRLAKPGGHWNHAYRYVTLHQPAAFYGVNSRNLGPGGNALASGAEILAYYESVLATLMASGKVTCCFQSEYRGEGRIRPLLSPDEEIQVSVRQKIVDSTYMKVQVPFTTPPAFEVADSVELVPPNALGAITKGYEEFVVIGAGKTGIDAVLYLLDQGVAEERIVWIVSNDAWLLNRDLLTPGRTVGWFVQQLKRFAESETLDELFLKTEESGSFLRIDRSIWPSKFRCATVNPREVAALRSLSRIVRLGRVRRIEPNKVELKSGSFAANSSTLFVNCTADGLAKRPAKAVFEGQRITLQSLFMCQQVFSAALIAQVECGPGSDEKKNALCSVVPHPEFNADYPSAMVTSNRNFDAWGRELFRWLRRSRLSLMHHESLGRLLLNLYRAQRIAPKALAAAERMAAAAAPTTAEST